MNEACLCSQLQHPTIKRSFHFIPHHSEKMDLGSAKNPASQTIRDNSYLYCRVDVGFGWSGLLCIKFKSINK